MILSFSYISKWHIVYNFSLESQLKHILQQRKIPLVTKRSMKKHMFSCITFGMNYLIYLSLIMPKNVFFSFSCISKWHIVYNFSLESQLKHILQKFHSLLWDQWKSICFHASDLAWIIWYIYLKIMPKNAFVFFPYFLLAHC